MEQLQGKHTSVWLDTTPETHYSPLKQDVHVDVVIIGGGIAGISTAYMLKHTGKTVAVLEADRIVQGVSGQTTAHITSGQNIFYDSLTKQIGEEKAKLYAEANQTAIQKVAEIVNENKIACDFRTTSQYIFAEKETDIETLRKEFDAAKKLGLPVTFEEVAPLPFKTFGAIQYHDQAQFHPRKYLLALAEKINGNESYIFENTRAFDVKDDDVCVVKTEHGDIHANDVVIAMHFPFLDRGGFFARMKVDRSYVLGMYVEDEFEHQMFENTDDPYYYIRTQPTERGILVLVGGQDHTTGQKENTDECYKKLEEYARSHFKVKSIEYFWSSQDNYPFDHVPFIGKFMPTSKHVYVATGFNAYGMTHGTITGMLLTDMILGKQNAWEKVYTPQRFNVTTEGPTMLKTGIHEGIQFIKGKFSAASQEEINTLSPGRGKVVDIDGEKVAVYKDETGKLYELSATCQHMGCTVTFNTAEKSWDCPCHGSRFGIDGTVLHGPTVKPLPKVTLHE